MYLILHREDRKPNRGYARKHRIRELRSFFNKQTDQKENIET